MPFVTLLNEWGIPVRLLNISEMSWPMRCLRCSHVHDAGKVTVLGRYSDCSTWRCPGCNALIDDRPAAWGGSAVPVT